MEINSQILQWTWEHLFSLAAIIISFLAYLKSRAANKLSKEANNIAEKANQLLTIDMIYNKEKDTEKLVNEIIDRIIENWSKNGGCIANLMAEWDIYNKKLTEQDFQNILNIAYQRVKKKMPAQSFQMLLNEHNKKN